MKFIILFVILNCVFALDCSGGAYEKNGKCHVCDEHCAKACVKDKGCESCKDGYFVNFGACDPCMYGCVKCTNLEVCTQCNSATHYMMEGNCYVKPKNCDVMENGVGCKQCAEGFFLSNVTNGICTECGDACDKSSCDRTKTDGCTKIAAGKSGFIYNKIAYSCDENCVKCNDGSVAGQAPGCGECKSGYYLKKVEKSSSSNEVQFDSCEKCSAICAKCTGSSNNCTECNSGYYIYNVLGTNMKSCRPKQEEAQGCTTWGTECTQCKTGYEKLNGVCVPSVKTENKCPEGFTSLGETCVLKSQNCLEFEATSNKCTKCADLYYLENGFCVSCDENCLRCQQTGTKTSVPPLGACLECKSGYFTNGSNICHPSADLDETVAPWVIGTETKPFRCQEGYYIDNHAEPKGRNCKLCSPYCLTERIESKTEDGNITQTTISYCDSAFGCTRCKEGFYVSVDGECSSCPAHCSYCDQTLGCLHCLGETIMDHGTCVVAGAPSVLSLLILVIVALLF